MYSVQLGSHADIGAEPSLRPITVQPRGWSLLQWAVAGLILAGVIITAVFAGLAWTEAKHSSSGSADTSALLACCRNNTAHLAGIYALVHSNAEALETLQADVGEIETCVEENKETLVEVIGDIAAVQETADAIETTTTETQVTVDWIHASTNGTDIGAAFEQINTDLGDLSSDLGDVFLIVEANGVKIDTVNGTVTWIHTVVNEILDEVTP